MSLSKLFWFTALSTIVFLGMYIYGFDLLNIVLAMMIINMVVLKASSDELFSKLKITQSVSGKMEKIEDVMLDLTKFMRDKEAGSTAPSSKMADITLGGIEGSFKKQAGIIKQDIDEKLDRMATKSVDIENKLNDIKKTFSAAIASLDDRLHTIERPGEEATVESDSYTELPEEFN